jgi:hypothetical protein
MSGPGVSSQEWSARRYAETAHFVPALGAPVLDLRHRPGSASSTWAVATES